MNISYDEVANMRFDTLVTFAKNATIKLGDRISITIDHNVLIDHHNGIYDDLVCLKFDDYKRTEKLYKLQQSTLKEFVSSCLQGLKVYFDERACQLATKFNNDMAAIRSSKDYVMEILNG